MVESPSLTRSGGAWKGGRERGGLGRRTQASEHRVKVPRAGRGRRGWAATAGRGGGGVGVAGTGRGGAGAEVEGLEKRRRRHNPRDAPARGRREPMGKDLTKKN